MRKVANHKKDPKTQNRRMDVLEVDKSGQIIPLVRLYNNNQLIMFTKKPRRVSSMNFSKYGEVTLRVIYGKDLYNHGTYNTKKDLLEALKQFTEPELLKVAKNWYN
jgi:hypothetical protein